METSIAKTSSSKSVILASIVKFDLLRKIFWLLPGPATQRDCLRRLPLWTVTRLLTGDLHACPSSGAPGTINQSRLRIVLFQPIRGRDYPLQKKQLTRPRKKHFVLEASGYFELGKDIFKEHVTRKFFSSLMTAYYFSSIRNDDFKLEPILATQAFKCCLSWFKILKSQLPFFGIVNGQIWLSTTRIWEKFS